MVMNSESTAGPEEQLKRAILELKASKKEARALRKGLTTLTTGVVQFIAWLDEEMKMPGDHKRGSRVAKATNKLELMNDRERKFTLGLSWQTMNNATAKAKRMLKK